MGKFLDAFTKDLLEAIEKFQDFADHNLYKKWCDNTPASLSSASDE